MKLRHDELLSNVAFNFDLRRYIKFPGADTLLGPEMRSTGEVMGIDRDFVRAYAKAWGCRLTLSTPC